MTSLRRLSNTLNRLLLWSAAGVMLCAMAMAVANMLGRPFKMPVPGSFELMGLASALIAACALGITQEERKHIAVDLLFRHFPAALQRWLETCCHLLCAGFFCIAAWRLTRFGLRLLSTGEVSETLGLPTYPFAFTVALGFWALTLTLLADALDTLREPREAP